MDFILHLKGALIEEQLVLGTSKLQDWFNLLSLDSLKELASTLEDFKRDTRNNTDNILMLVYLLCQIEGFDLYNKYRQNSNGAARDFSYLVNLEILSRQGYIRILNELSFLNPDNCKIELLDPQLV